LSVFVMRNDDNTQAQCISAVAGSVCSFCSSARASQGLPGMTPTLDVVDLAPVATCDSRWLRLIWLWLMSCSLWHDFCVTLVKFKRSVFDMFFELFGFFRCTLVHCLGETLGWLEIWNFILRAQALKHSYEHYHLKLCVKLTMDTLWIEISKCITIWL